MVFIVNSLLKATTTRYSFVRRTLATTTARPFQILGVQQIAIGCIEKGPVQALWYDVFGLKDRVVDSVRLEKENVEEDIVQLGPKPFSVEIDLMSPIDPEKSPKVHVPPLNHIGLWVDDLEKAVDWMQNEAGVRFTPGGIRPGAAGHNITFIHPKGKGENPVGGAGVLVELVQAPENVIKAFAEASKNE